MVLFVCSCTAAVLSFLLAFFVVSFKLHTAHVLVWVLFAWVFWGFGLGFFLMLLSEPGNTYFLKVAL